MEGVVSAAFADAFRGKSVWLSGHTGFKGAWLATWLLELGARVHGYALKPATTPSLFEQLGLADALQHEIGDIRDAGAVERSIRAAAPEFVFHLAAQPLVRLSYEEPVETYQTNVMGTVHVLEALRKIQRPCAVVIVTTDKCYENREWLHAYREEDPLGGHDPYSSSKAAAEIAVAAYRRSFFDPPTNPKVKIATARAGNVIGGGDWASDRIVPDTIRALQQNQSVAVRNKGSTRPWQHVLEPLSGYLALAAALTATHSDHQLCSAFNFGPALDSNRTVEELVDEILKHLPGQWIDRSDPAALHEAKLLNLATDKAAHLLGWSPVWRFEECIDQTVIWYRHAFAASPREGAADLLPITRNQIEQYRQAAGARGLSWAGCSVAEA